MSRIYFHSKYGYAEVLGPERSYAGVLCNRLTLAVLMNQLSEGYSSGLSPLRKILPADSYVLQAKQGIEFDRMFDTWFSVALNSDKLKINGLHADQFEISLNTAIKLGNDALKLLARLHGQCEIHTWVDAHNKLWLSKIIERGLSDNILRHHMGWEKVIDLLAQANDSPVVTSFSVCEQFPNRFICQEHETFNGSDDEWYEKLTDDDRWNLSMQALRLADKWLEIKPEQWDDYHFGNGITAFDMVESLLNEDISHQ